MTDQEQIDALKAQVNCLRERLYIIYAAPRSANSFKDLQSYALEALEATPEQCLAEVKAKAIEDVANALLTDEDYHKSDEWYVDFIMRHANKIRE